MGAISDTSPPLADLLPSIKINVMNRWGAAGFHLALSVLLIGVVSLLITMFWFPSALWPMSQISGLIGLIAIVDITIGPLLTLIVYKHGKRTLKFDLTVIVILQLVVLVYGLHILAQNRPIFIVGNIDRMDLVLAQEIDDADLAMAPEQWRKRSWTGPIVVGANMPEEQELRQQLLFDGLAGRDLQHQPVFFVEIETVLPGLLTRARPVNDLLDRLNTTERRRLQRAARNHPLDQLRYLDLASARGTAIVLITPDDQLGNPVAIDPYEARLRRPSDG